MGFIHRSGSRMPRGGALRDRVRMARIEIPSELGLRFAVADARRQGVSASRLRGSDLDRPFHGVRSIRRPGDQDADAAAVVWDRALSYAGRMSRHEFFSHITSAVLWGLPLPGLRALDLDVGVFAPHRLPRGRGVRGHQLRPGRAAVVEHSGGRVRLLDPASTWAVLGARLRHYDLVALGDAITREWRLPVGHAPLATLAELESIVGSGRRVGIGALREALPRIRNRSASRPETWLRLTLEDGGLPEPELNVAVRVGRGARVALDLAYPRRRVGIEYEGDHHRTDPAQWLHDIERYEMLADAGWRIVRVTRGDLFERPQQLVARVRAALARF